MFKFALSEEFWLPSQAGSRDFFFFCVLFYLFKYLFTMASKVVHLTEAGLQKIKSELEHLRSVERPAISAAIAEARDKGDRSENAEYDAARSEQAANEGEIAELDYKVKNAVIIEESDDNSTVHIGSEVTVYDEEFEEETVYTIMGTTEVDVDKNVISNESPVGAALLKHKKGDRVTVKAPDGDYTLKILKIN